MLLHHSRIPSWPWSAPPSTARIRGTATTSGSITSSNSIKVPATDGFPGSPGELDVLLRHRLLPQPNCLEGLGTVKVIVRLDDQAVSEAVNDGESPRVRRVAGTLADHAGTGDEAAIPDVDQVVEAYLDRSDELDQASIRASAAARP